MPFVLSPRSALASPLRLRSSSVAAAAASSSAPGIGPAPAAGSTPRTTTASWCARRSARPLPPLALGLRRLIGGADEAVSVLPSWLQLGCGLVTLDYLATADAYPRPDDKIRTGELQISGGGNAGNALTAAARLGLNTRVISKVANDETGGTVLSELMEAGIDTSHVIISDGGNTTFVYIIIDKQTKTRACILTPGDPPIVPSDLPMSSLSAALQDVSLLYLDGYSPKWHWLLLSRRLLTYVGKWRKVDAEQEKTKEELEGLLSLASYIVCSGKFPENWTSMPSLPCALLEILLQYPRAKFVIATLGEKGCMMLERSESGDGVVEDAADIEVVSESLKLELHKDDVLPTCVSSQFTRLSARGLGTVFGRLLIGTAEVIPASELVDTTGCGDAFIGAVLHALSAEMPPEKMLPFASQVAGIKCRAVGARAGLPWCSDQRLAMYL
ncbi:hypothetical protein C2845_PM01G40570 [Panicum miliaceum]|uniref:Carbohydrate kinase PfkB domain-containing protein n=1 Tax=Panicum miliaceum TaxID=4540 RepID=A0A3L6TPY7_PANMI|nr:hypothetical protein C2845_PM01G40570 [Panicum miliaceum]